MMEDTLMASEAQLKSHARWEADNCVRVTLKLNKRTDAEILELVSSADSMQGIIKQALREYLANHKEERED